MRYVMLVVGGLLLPTTAGAQSFNCLYARYADEVRICRDNSLRQLDELLATTYSKLKLQSRGYGRAKLERSQADWLRVRRDCASDRSCLIEVYEDRLYELGGVE